MNAAEKAAQAKSKENEARILQIFEEAQQYHLQSNADNCYSKKDINKAKGAAKKAIKLYTKCAEEGHVESMECLAKLYFDCIFDEKKEVYWCLKAAENGSIDCMNELIWRYRDGTGVVQSDSTSLRWKGRLQSRLDELFEEAMQKYTECKENFDSYSNGAKPDVEELKSGDRQLLNEVVIILTKCIEFKHVKSSKILEEICHVWLHDGHRSLRG